MPFSDLLRLLARGAPFLVLERLLPLHGRQKVWRSGVIADLAHYVVNSFILVAVLSVVLTPAMVLAAVVMPAGGRSAVAAEPVWVQFLALTLVSDLGIYVGHRLTHVVPWLWRFHAIHHSATEVDWLTTTRSHPVDQIGRASCR